MQSVLNKPIVLKAGNLIDIHLPTFVMVSLFIFVDNARGDIFEQIYRDMAYLKPLRVRILPQNSGLLYKFKKKSVPIIRN